MYTYDKVVEEGTKAGVLSQFTEADHAAAKANPEYGISLVGLLRDMNNASTAEQKVLTSAAAEKLRKDYGVTGATVAAGSFPSGKRVAAPGKAGELSATDPSSYEAVLNDFINQKEFSYDPRKDSAYQAYARAYLGENERVVEDTLAKAAAMSGGRPSSYAITAAQQAGDAHAAQLAAAIPSFQQEAYTKYLNDQEAKKNILSVLQSAEEARMKQEAAQQQAEQQQAATQQRQEVINNILGGVADTVGNVIGAAKDAPGKIADWLKGYISSKVSSGEGEVAPAPVPKKTVKKNIEDWWNSFTSSEGSSNKDDSSGEEGPTTPGTSARNQQDSTKDPKTGRLAGTITSGITSNKIKNEHGNSWIKVGDQTITFEMLEDMVKNGEIEIRVDPETGVVEYVTAPSRKPGTK